MDSYVQKDINASRLIGDFTEMSVKLFNDNRDFFQFCLEFFSIAPRDPDIKKEVTDFYQQRIRTFGDTIKKGISKGHLRKIKSDNAARTLFFLSMGSFLMYFAADNDFDFIEQQAVSMDIILKGLKNDGHHSSS